MRYKTQRYQGVFSWIRHGWIFCGLILVLVGSFAGAVQANQLYVTTMSWESEDVGVGTGPQPATVLIVLYGERDDLEQRLQGAVANLGDLSLYPASTLQCVPDGGSQDVSLIAPDGATDGGIAPVPESVNSEYLSGLEFAPLEAGEHIVLHPGDLACFAITPAALSTKELLASASNVILSVSVESLEGGTAVPEPTAFLLLGIGVVGLLGVRRIRSARHAAGTPSKTTPRGR